MLSGKHVRFGDGSVGEGDRFAPVEEGRLFVAIEPDEQGIAHVEEFSDHHVGSVPHEPWILAEIEERERGDGPGRAEEGRPFEERMVRFPAHQRSVDEKHWKHRGSGNVTGQAFFPILDRLGPRIIGPMRAQTAITAAGRYLRENPSEIGRALRGALGLRFGLPIAALRWLGRELEATGKVADLQIDAVPPGLRVRAKVDLMRTPVRASASVFIERVVARAGEIAVTVRLEDLNLKVDGESQSPVALLLRSGALDLSKPGNLLANLPNRPPMIVDARENRIVIDVMRDPKLGRNARIVSAVELVTSLVTVHAIESDTEHLDVAFRAIPEGMFTAARAVRRHLVMPALGRLLPG